MVSQGVPMMLMGDEMGRTQHGNNNAYCHDNELNWLDWGLLAQNPDLFEFAQRIIAFRHAHPVLRPKEHFRGESTRGCSCADITWHGTRAWSADWSAGSRVMAFMLCGNHAKGGTVQDDQIYVAVNMYWDALPFELPEPPDGRLWYLSVNTSMPASEDIFEPGCEPLLQDQGSVLVGGRSVVVLVGR